MKKYQCYYNEPVFFNGRRYLGERVDTRIFDTEEDAERYCANHVGTTSIENDKDCIGCEVFRDSLGSYVKSEMFYEEIG